MTKNGFGYHDPFANLAAAILESGKRHHDVTFLESDWADTLREICRLDDIMYGNRNIGTRGRTHVSNAHMGVEDG